MNKVLIAAAALSLSASVAFAGGPVKIVEEGEPEVLVTGGSSSSAGPSSGGAVLPIVAGVLLIAALAGGSGT